MRTSDTTGQTTTHGSDMSTRRKEAAHNDRETTSALFADPVAFLADHGINAEIVATTTETRLPAAA